MKLQPHTPDAVARLITVIATAVKDFQEREGLLIVQDTLVEAHLNLLLGLVRLSLNDAARADLVVESIQFLLDHAELVPEDVARSFSTLVLDRATPAGNA